MDFLGTPFTEAAQGVYVSLDGLHTLVMPGAFWLDIQLVLDEMNPVKGN